MRRPLVTFVVLIFAVCWLSHAVLQDSMAADEKDQVLFSFADEATVKDWAPIKLPEVEKDQPAPKVETVAAPKSKDDPCPAGKCLKITFDGGEWPTIGTSKVPVPGNWKQFQRCQTRARGLCNASRVRSLTYHRISMLTLRVLCML